MKAGQFNIFEYLERLNEEAESGNLAGKDKEGLIIPDENKKSYDWLKKEYDRAQTEVKVEITGQGASFKPGYDLQTKLDSVKDFKPGMFGEVKTADTKTEKKEGEEKENPSLDPKKDKPSFQPGEGEKEKKELPKTSDKKEDIKNKEEEKPEEKEEKSEEKEEPKEKEEKPEVKKIDLKTKKK
jgi:hypothetical protein